MPKYVFQCEKDGCDVRFERVLPLDNHKTHACPGCGNDAPRYIEGEGFAFAFTGHATGSTANTGVHKEDYPTADHVVGKSADARWGEYAARNKVKDAARSQGGAYPLIRHTSKGHIDYEPMSDGGRVARRNLAKKAIATLREQAEHRKR